MIPQAGLNRQHFTLKLLKIHPLDGIVATVAPVAVVRGLHTGIVCILDYNKSRKLLYR